MGYVIRFFLFSLLVYATGVVHAHEIRPAFLEVNELSDTEYETLLKVPVRGGQRLAVDVEFPSGCEMTAPAQTIASGGYLSEYGSIYCPQGIAGGVINANGLAETLTDMLARIVHLDGRVQMERLTPAKTGLNVQADPGAGQVVVTYTALGIEHILLGIDHLLFVLALLMLVEGWRRLLWTITSFTLAHSLTLVAATMGLIHVPQQPVEAVIALSIVFLATEIIHNRQGRPGMANRWPWTVAFVFGLLHGLGFAGALSEIGLPPSSVPLALLFFNVGVEIGQILFITAVLVGYRLLKIFVSPRENWAKALPAYAIGGIAAYWTIERIYGFWV